MSIENAKASIKIRLETEMSALEWAKEDLLTAAQVSYAAFLDGEHIARIGHRITEIQTRIQMLTEEQRMLDSLDA